MYQNDLTLRLINAFERGREEKFGPQKPRNRVGAKLGGLDCTGKLLTNKVCRIKSGCEY